MVNNLLIEGAVRVANLAKQISSEICPLGGLHNISALKRILRVLATLRPQPKRQLLVTTLQGSLRRHLERLRLRRVDHAHDLLAAGDALQLRVFAAQGAANDVAQTPSA